MNCDVIRGNLCDSSVLLTIFIIQLKVANNMNVVTFLVSCKPISFPAAIPALISCFCSGCHTVKQLRVIILPSS